MGQETLQYRWACHGYARHGGTRVCARGRCLMYPPPLSLSRAVFHRLSCLAVFIPHDVTCVSCLAEASSGPGRDVRRVSL